MSTYRFWFREKYLLFSSLCSTVGKHCYWCPRTVDDLKKESRKKNPILHSTDRAHDVMYNLLFRPVQRNNNTVPSSVRLFSVKCFLSFTINCHAALSFMFTLFAHPVFIVAALFKSTRTSSCSRSRVFLGRKEPSETGRPESCRQDALLSLWE